MKNVTMTFTDEADTDHMVYMSDVESWPEIAEKFYFLLVSSGYVLSMKDLSLRYAKMAEDFGSTLNNVSGESVDENQETYDYSVNFDDLTDGVNLNAFDLINRSTVTIK